MIISVTNQKGGVGKSTTTANIGAGLVEMGFKVLLIDWDEQGNLTQSFGIKEPECTILEGLQDEEKFVPYSIKDERLMLMASDQKLSMFDMVFMNVMTGKDLILKKKVEQYKLRDQFDFIFIDCAPGQGLRNINAYMASDFLLVPIEAHAFSDTGLNQVTDLVVDLVADGSNPNLNIAGIFFTRHKGNTVISKSYVNNVRAKYENLPVYNTVIRENVNVKEASETGLDIFSYVEEYEIINSNGAMDYHNLILEFLEVLDMEPRKPLKLPVAKPKQKPVPPKAIKRNDNLVEEVSPKPAEAKKKMRKAGKEDLKKGFEDFLSND